MNRSIFVSYSRNDRSWCSLLVNELRRRGFDLYHDETSNWLGLRWVKKLEDEISKRDVFLIVLSPASWHSPWVQEELHLALAKQKTILPILLEPTNTDGFIETRQWINAIDLSPADMADIIQKTIQSEEFQLTTKPAMKLSGQADLRLVDVVLSYTEKAPKFPILEVKLRNSGIESAFVKEARFDFLEVVDFFDPREYSPKLVELSATYAVDFSQAKEKRVLKVKLSHALKPNEVDRFSFELGHSNRNYRILDTWYFFTIGFVYNEDSRELISNPIIVDMRPVVTWAGMYVHGYNRDIAIENLSKLRRMAAIDAIRSPNVEQVLEKYVKHHSEHTDDHDLESEEKPDN